MRTVVTKQFSLLSRIKRLQKQLYLIIGKLSNLGLLLFLKQQFKYSLHVTEVVGCL